MARARPPRRGAAPSAPPSARPPAGPAPSFPSCRFRGAVPGRCAEAGPGEAAAAAAAVVAQRRARGLTEPGGRPGDRDRDRGLPPRGGAGPPSPPVSRCSGPALPACRRPLPRRAVRGGGGRGGSGAGRGTPACGGASCRPWALPPPRAPRCGTGRAWNSGLPGG